MSRSEVDFLKESDRLKSILRRTSIHDQSRRENSAEHSWQLALAVMSTSHLANEPFDVERAMKMALLHDLVEIDAGDTFVYDTAANENKLEREMVAAERIFGLIPERNEEFKRLWLDFENQSCPESRFVAALDRFLPVMLNYMNDGLGWRTHGIPYSRIHALNKKIALGSLKLWDMAEQMINECRDKGFIEPN